MTPIVVTQPNRVKDLGLAPNLLVLKVSNIQQWEALKMVMQVFKGDN